MLINPSTGSIGTSMLRGFLGQTNVNPTFKFAACVRSPASLERLRGEFSAHQDDVKLFRGDVVGTCQGASMVILACEPHDLTTLLASPGLIESLKGKLVVSLIAGLPSEKLLENFQHFQHFHGGETLKASDFHISRVIPSIGACIQDSVSLVASAPSVTSTQATVLDSLLASIGVVQHVPESLMNESTALSATSHALAIVAVEALADAGVAEGLPRSTATLFAAGSLKSCSNVIANGQSPSALKERMSTPCGVTINAVLGLENGSIRSIFANAARNTITHTRGMSAKHE